MKILYLEDDVREAQHFISKLFSMGFEPTWEKTMEGAYKHLPFADGFSFGLFDIKLLQEEGDKSGIVVAARFLKEQNMPVFLLSNYANDANIVNEAIRAGIPANFIFPKQITEEHTELFRQSLITAVESNGYDRFANRQSETTAFFGKIGLSSGQGGIRWFIKQEDILFIKGDGDGCQICFRTGTSPNAKMVRFGRNLDSALKQLERNFKPFTIVRFGKSWAVNLTQIERMEEGAVHFHGVKESCGAGPALEAYFASNGWNLKTGH